jgi:hypothetical protein
LVRAVAARQDVRIRAPPEQLRVRRERPAARQHHPILAGDVEVAVVEHSDGQPVALGCVAPSRAAREPPATNAFGPLTGLRRPARVPSRTQAERTRAFAERYAPPGQLGSPGAEAGLARSYWLLEMFESVYRSGAVDQSMDRVFRTGVPTVEVMRAAASEPVVEELARLAQQTQSYGALAELRRLAGNPAPGQSLGIAGPVFVNRWADGDLLISGPDGATLVDVKTVVKTDRADRSARWLRQLLCYAWLDTTDRYRIRNVAFYFAPTASSSPGPSPSSPTCSSAAPIPTRPEPNSSRRQGRP